MQPREVPVIQINTETEVFIGTLSPTGLLYRRPDSDDPADRYRLWEVPGASHVSNDTRDPVLVLQLHDRALRVLRPVRLQRPVRRERSALAVREPWRLREPLRPAG